MMPLVVGRAATEAGQGREPARRVPAGASGAGPLPFAPARSRRLAEAAAAPVTVALPVYNGERYVGEAIDSLLDQTFADFELIISDNASTDRTAAICQDYAERDPRISYYRQQRNIGGSGNFNFLLAQARSRYFKWAGSDDVCKPSLLQSCFDILEREPKVVLAYSRVDKIGEDGSNLGVFTEGMDLREASPLARFSRQIRMHGWLAPTQVYGLVRTDLLRALGGLGPFPGSDLVLFASMSLLGEFAEIPEVLAFRRIHAENSDIRYKSDADLAVGWFRNGDSAHKKLHKWRRSGEYVKAIGHLRIPLWQKAASIAMLGGKLLVGPDAALGRRVMLGEVTTLARRLAERNDPPPPRAGA
jgi:glycosyltransferase involved in cell wall biosynthesis